jgi:hypothetical protein
VRLDGLKSWNLGDTLLMPPEMELGLALDDAAAQMEAKTRSGTENWVRYLRTSENGVKFVMVSDPFTWLIITWAGSTRPEAPAIAASRTWGNGPAGAATHDAAIKVLMMTMRDLSVDQAEGLLLDSVFPADPFGPAVGAPSPDAVEFVALAVRRRSADGAASYTNTMHHV